MSRFAATCRNRALALGLLVMAPTVLTAAHPPLCRQNKGKLTDLIIFSEGDHLQAQKVVKADGKYVFTDPGTAADLDDEAVSWGPKVKMGFAFLDAFSEGQTRTATLWLESKVNTAREATRTFQLQVVYKPAVVPETFEDLGDGYYGTMRKTEKITVKQVDDLFATFAEKLDAEFAAECAAFGLFPERPAEKASGPAAPAGGASKVEKKAS